MTQNFKDLTRETETSKVATTRKMNDLISPLLCKHFSTSRHHLSFFVKAPENTADLLSLGPSAPTSTHQSFSPCPPSTYSSNKNVTNTHSFLFYIKQVRSKLVKRREVTPKTLSWEKWDFCCCWPGVRERNVRWTAIVISGLKPVYADVSDTNRYKRWHRTRLWTASHAKYAHSKTRVISKQGYRQS
jgi:hypothetical protein